MVPVSAAPYDSEEPADSARLAARGCGTSPASEVHGGLPRPDSSWGWKRVWGLWAPGRSRCGELRKPAASSCPGQARWAGNQGPLHLPVEAQVRPLRAWLLPLAVNVKLAAVRPGLRGPWNSQRRLRRGGLA